MERPAPIVAWHEVVETRDLDRLHALLADDVVFRSPAIHAPQEGRMLTATYLTAAMVVLGPTLRYVREWYAEDSAVLDFRVELDGVSVQGVDIITWGRDGLITDFTVLVRPMKGLQKVIELMGAELLR